MAVNLSDLVDYIVKRSEQEGHLSYFEGRGQLWKALKASGLLSRFVAALSSVFDEILSEFQDVEDGYIAMKMKWLEVVSDCQVVHNDSREQQHGSLLRKIYDKVQSLVCERRGDDLPAILHTIAVHQFDYLHKAATATSKSAKKALEDTVSRKRTAGRPRKAATTKLPTQTDSDILRLASVVIGKMFKFYKNKKRRATSFNQLRVLASMAAVSRQTEFLTPERRARSPGGLYVMSKQFLPALRVLDNTIREQLRSGSHGKDIVKVPCVYFVYTRKQYQVNNR